MREGEREEGKKGGREEGGEGGYKNRRVVIWKEFIIYHMMV